MSPRVNHPDSLATEFEDIKRRLRALETSPQLGYSSVDQGAFQVKDNTGVVRAEMGLVGGGYYGLNLYDSGGAKVFAVSNNGVLLPTTPLTTRDASAFKAQTQGTFNVSDWWSGVPVVSANAVTASLPWSTDSGVTGEIRLVVKAAPNTGSAVVASTSAVALPATSNGTQVFNWLHGQAKGSGPWYLGVQGRVTGGVGNVNLYSPNYVAMIGSEQVNATNTGV